jgi:hypothetical protein
VTKEILWTILQGKKVEKFSCKEIFQGINRYENGKALN